MSNQATLKLVGTSDLSAIARDLKNIATEGKSAGPALASLNRSLDDSAKKATTFGQKVKSFGSTFSSSIASIGTLGGTVLNLSRQYQDLDDSQIRVDRSQLKVSKTTEAVGVAQGKLNELTKKGITNGAEYDKALLDVKQALEAQDLAERNLKEAQEDHQRAQENFWVGLVPTVTSAGASIISVINDMGGTKGFSGLVGKMSGVGEAVKGLGISMKGALIGTGIGAAIVALGLALEAFANNWWGVRDAVNDMGVALGNALPGLQPVLTALGKIGEGIVSTFGQGGTVTTALAESSLAIREFGDTSTASLDKALKMLDFQKRLAEATKHMDDILMASRNDQERAAAIKAVEDLIKEGNKLLSTETQQQALARNGIKLYADSTGVKMKDAGATNSLSTATDGLGQSTAALGPAIRGLGTDASNTWAELAKSTIPQVITWTSDWDAMTKLLNPTLAAEKTAVAAVNPELQAMADWMNQVVIATNAQAASAARAKTQTAQLSGVLAQATKNAQAYVRAVTPSQAGKSGGGGGGAPPVHFVGGPVPGARNPDFRLRSDWQKAKIIKAASGMHETVTQPTWILAGEAGKERVDIGGGDGTTVVNVFVDGVQRPARYSIGTRK